MKPEPDYARMLEIIQILSLEYLAPTKKDTSKRYIGTRTSVLPARFHLPSTYCNPHMLPIWREFHSLVGDAEPTEAFFACHVRDPEVALFFEAYHRLGL